MSEPIQLDQLVSIRGRFSRSVRLDKDAEQVDQLKGYLPTGRSLEVVRRLIQAMSREDGTRAFSITGPYGSGKSSLALFIDALLGNSTQAGHRAALELLKEYEPKLVEQLEEARRSLGAGPSGFIRAVITAPQREPITVTVLRALVRGARRSQVPEAVRTSIVEALERAESDRYASPSYREIRGYLEQLTEAGSKKPVLLVIDEFGKNLEAYAESGREGDLYLLQELAEWATGGDALPLVLVTIQHLAFEAYAADATSAQRREWAKVQGRFEDIPFVDSAAATRTLIATALDHSDDPLYGWLRAEASNLLAEEAEAHGLPAVADPVTVAACYPLHPSTLQILPELCSRYGQNERTLFSFLASDEPRSVTSFLREADAEEGLPWVRLDRVYDYFVESASTFVGASREASRWIEVETSIRDAHGITPAQRRVLKAVGVLNLVSAGGSLRASRELVAYTMADGGEGTETVAEVEERLAELEDAGLIVFRDFASEYRVWRGSDFDISGALRSARRQVRQRSLAELLNEMQPMRPLVAARHTIRSGSTRAFARIYADRHTTLPDLDRRDDKSAKEDHRRLHGCDGLLVYVVDHEGREPQIQLPANDLPLVTVVPSDSTSLIEAATEVAALLEVAEDPNLPAEDQAARRELVERTAYARQVLDRTISETFAGEAAWTWHNPLNKDGSHPKYRKPRSLDGGLGTAALSEVFDRVFACSPPVHYEVINRTELTSQGSKARRIVLEAALTPARRREDRLGLEGEGADVATYYAILEDSGIHDPREGIRPPTSSAWKPVWAALTRTLRSATGAPVSVEHLLRSLKEPPYGVKDGTASVLLALALVVHAAEIAIYEHGTFRPRLDAPLSERMLRNPDNFAVKHLAAGAGSKRHQALEALARVLSEVLPDEPAVQAAKSNPTVLTVTLALVDVLHRNRDDFTRKSKQFQRLWNPDVPEERVVNARGVRDALLETHEPDVLLFEQLPAAVDSGRLPASGRGADAMAEGDIADFASAVGHAVALIERVHDDLIGEIERVIAEAAGCNTLEEAVSKADDLESLDVLSTPVRRFADVARMREAYTDLEAWLGAVTETVCGGSMRHWTDHTARGNLERLRQTVSDYARVAELARFQAEQPDASFRAYRLEVTSQRGASQQGVVTVPEDELSHLCRIVDRAVEEAGSRLGIEGHDAREALLAAMMTEFVSDAINGPEKSVTEDTATGDQFEEGAVTQ